MDPNYSWNWNLAWHESNCTTPRPIQTAILVVTANLGQRAPQGLSQPRGCRRTKAGNLTKRVPWYLLGDEQQQSTKHKYTLLTRRMPTPTSKPTPTSIPTPTRRHAHAHTHPSLVAHVTQPVAI